MGVEISPLYPATESTTDVRKPRQSWNWAQSSGSAVASSRLVSISSMSCFSSTATAVASPAAVGHSGPEHVGQNRMAGGPVQAPHRSARRSPLPTHGTLAPKFELARVAELGGTAGTQAVGLGWALGGSAALSDSSPPAYGTPYAGDSESRAGPADDSEPKLATCARHRM